MGTTADAGVSAEPDRSPETLLVKPAVELDLHSRTDLAAAVDRALRRFPLMVAIDLREVEFIDSAALAAVAAALRRCDAQGVRGVIVRGVHRQVTRLIELTGMEKHAEFIDGSDLPPRSVTLA
jgi:anti-anti-sigma factor